LKKQLAGFLAFDSDDVNHLLEQKADYLILHKRIFHGEQALDPKDAVFKDESLFLTVFENQDFIIYRLKKVN
jgi:hypothetical protein